MSTRKAWIGGIAVALIAGVGLVLWLAGDEEERAAPDAEADDEWEDEWLDVDDDGDLAMERSPRRPSVPREPLPSPTAREARRAEWRERWRRSVDIVPLGPSDPGFDADDLRAALAPGREALRECVREAGGWRALREAFRAAGRPRRRGTVSFDVLPDGRVDAGSISFEPPIPERFDPCFRTFFASARLERVGADGARVELPMGPPRRRWRDGSADGGVPFGRFGRGGWRERSGPRAPTDRPGANDPRPRSAPADELRR
ncbi:MAG TPA: hypothetical protein VIL20_01495 [Sandaracinaceae bacterium]